ncbi:flagellar filament capping protein FliD [Saccharibacillus alkalitolerans]|uniref:Flagellar hook-associated protein 2 n=1 Tax=Saccharibacillus alkalitolerans TaxID=2705290 RepID=A0ABX0F5A4_9BACL|nr:flagellar filament capping protein FliD [Saccharibacillus alkalitolerans]NGZ76118.1 flagellar filament capping protein FliD [Saccharibacillus alkalitolerans]
MVTRISGMASGMDIDALVKSMVNARKGPLNKLNEQKQLLEWQRDDYRKMSTKLVTFMQDSISKLAQSSTINAQKATITGNTGALTASASSVASSGTMTIEVTKLATFSSVRSAQGLNKDSTTTKLSDLDSSFGTASVVTIGGADIALTADETIQSFVDKINSNSKTGVTAFYDSAAGLSLTSKTAGPDAVVVDASIKNAFNLTMDTFGSKAELNVNGLNIEKDSNSFDLNGVAITLNAAGGAATTVTVSKDTEKVVQAVQDFVNAYNDVISTVNGKISEERYKKYTPLTSEQRKEMSDDEAKLWDEKAKSGMLKNDSILQRTIGDMRAALIQGVDIGRVVNVDGVDVNKPLMMSELGITTGTYDTKGKLNLDTAKLTAALEGNPDIVNQFFGQNYSKSTLNNQYTVEDGILAKTRKISTAALSSLAEKAGTSKVSSDLNSTFLTTSLMGQRLTAIDRQITDWNSRLNRIETNYYKQFTAMETAINRYNATMSSLSGM